MSSICDDLRAAILQAAMQGKLTEQLPEDGDAEELLAKIISKKEALIESGSIRRQPVTKKILKDDAPFTIPDSWKWVRVGDLGLLESGFSFKSSDYGERGIQVVRISDLGEDEILTKNAVYYPDDPSLAKYEIKKYSILICLTGSIGKMALVTDDQKRYLNQRVGMYSLYEKSILDFLWRILHAENIKFDWISRKTSTNGNIKNEVVLDTLVPLPPVAEQKRIVEKIDELMARVADLEQSADALASLKKSFPSDIRDALLQAAMQGKLTEQLPEDGDAGDLLEQIKVEKEKLVVEGKIKKQKPLAPIAEDEIPFEIPENWRWVRLADIALKEIKRGKSPIYDNNGSSFAFAQKCNTKYDGINFQLAKRISDESLKRYAENDAVDELDIIVNSTGVGTLGRVGIIEHCNTSDSKYYPDSHVTLVRVPKGISKYIYIVLKTYENYFEKKGEGSTKQKELRPITIQDTFIPLPPLMEQKRIVERLDDLLKNIDMVEKLITSE